MSVSKLYMKKQDKAFVANLQQLMQQNSVSEAQLARETEIPQPTLHKILTGKTLDPRGSTLSILANYFSVSIEELLSGTPTLTQHDDLKINIQSIPVISWKDSVNNKEFIININSTNWHSWITTEFIHDYAFALQSKPSMGNRFPKQTLFIIDPSTEPEDGDLLLVQFPDTDEATLRDFSLDGPTKLLLPITKNANVSSLEEGIKIIGVVVQTRLEYKRNNNRK